MNILVLGIVLFVISVSVLEISFYAWRTIRNPNRSIIRKRLKRFSSSIYGNEVSDITKKRVLSTVPLLNRILLQITGIQSLERLIEQANAQYPVGFFILLTIVLALSGFLGVFLFTKNHAISLIPAALLAWLPIFYLFLKKKKRMGKFMRQLPEALDLIARALRAGHAFTNGMKLAAQEFDDPLGPEFDETLDEINFGVSVHDALKSLSQRIDCPDLKYFVVSVIIHRETGGNLAEIIESIAYLIRERFKLQGKIRVLSAEGKLSAIILIALPFLVIVALIFVNPKYINTLLFEPAGRLMAAIAGFGMAIGILVIKRMVRIKV